MPSSSLGFVDSELRPAALVGVRTFAVPGEGEPWTEVEAAEVFDSGRAVDGAMFVRRFGALPRCRQAARPPSWQPLCRTPEQRRIPRRGESRP
jgi:hypothetical protein